MNTLQIFWKTIWRSALFASVVFGIMWGCWHLPLFGVSYSSQAGIPLVMYLLYHIPLTVLMVWLVNHSEGSLLMALFFGNTRMNHLFEFAQIQQDLFRGDANHLQ